MTTRAQMDPTANLIEQRQIAERILRGTVSSTDARRLAELVQTLDEWRVTGGFDPYRPFMPTPEEWRGNAEAHKALLTSDPGYAAWFETYTRQRREQREQEYADALTEIA